LRTSSASSKGWNSHSIRKGLKTKLFGRVLLCFDKITSTNDLALELAMAGAEEGTVVIAETQTKGRGRMGRRWVSSSTRSITFSIVLRPKLHADEMSEITLSAAVGVAKTLEKWRLKPDIKWPNDLLISGKKVCGILTEMGHKKDKIGTVILGVGINLNQRPVDFPPELREKATSLYLASSKRINRKRFFQELLYQLETSYELVKERRFSKVLGEWKKRSMTIGRQVKVTQGYRTFFAQVTDVDEKGALLLRTDAGMMERLTSGDVELLKLNQAKPSVGRIGKARS
jgi:BirA family biotin operon repressor/biotin-[acetyl-CoA-carboxylase] ligase